MIFILDGRTLNGAQVWRKKGLFERIILIFTKALNKSKNILHSLHMVLLPSNLSALRNRIPIFFVMIKERLFV